VSYEELVELARRDDGILGLILTGSRGRGFAVTDESDWDVRLIVRDELRESYRATAATPHGSKVEVFVLSRSDLEEVGRLGSASAWDRYSYVEVPVVVDSADGSIGRLVAQLGTLDPGEARTLAAEKLDDYVNAYYRAAKNAGAGLADEARLDAAESIPLLLDFLFAVHGRVRPFNRFLVWELERQPLPGAAWESDALMSRLERVAAGDLAAQRQTFRDVESLARTQGLGDVLDGWEPDLAWLRHG
jgi:predicted nucleotidyltransferase